MRRIRNQRVCDECGEVVEASVRRRREQSAVPKAVPSKKVPAKKAAAKKPPAKK